MTDTPDEVITHAPERCGGCGADLADAELIGVERRQVTDVPEPTPVSFEHRVERRRCGCGTETAGSFPAHVRAPVSYGPRVRAIVVYLLARQHIPVAGWPRPLRTFSGCASPPGPSTPSTPTPDRLERFITALVALLRCLPVIHADETTEGIGTLN